MMIILDQRKSLKLFGLLFATAILGWATTVQGGEACTPDTYLGYLGLNDGPGTGCFNPVDPNLEYYNFKFATSSTVGNNSDIPNNITVTPDGGFGFDFGGFASVATGDLSYYLGFNIDPAPVLTGDSISLDPPVGNVTLNLYLCLPDIPFLTQSGANFYCSSQPVFGDGFDSQIFFSGPSPTTPAATLTNVDGTDQFTTATFAPTNQVGVLMQFTLTAGASVGAIGSAPTQIPATPEPRSWMLLVSGLLILLLKRCVALGRF